MKKLMSIISVIFILVSLTACGTSDPQHTLSYEKMEHITLYDEYECVAVFTQYTNDSSESAVPADNLTVKAYQNGVELSPLVPSGEKTNGYIQCDASVQSGVTANVVWIFQLDDNSTVSVEMPNGETVEGEMGN